MKFTDTIKKFSVPIFASIAIAMTVLYVYQKNFARFDIQHVPFATNFQYADSITCDVVYSTFRHIGESLFKVFEEPRFSISGLSSDTPKLSWAGFEYTMKKTQENDDAVLLQTIPVDDKDVAVQTFQILKKKGTFVRTLIEMGQYFGSREFIYPEGFQMIIAQKGRCK